MRRTITNVFFVLGLAVVGVPQAAAITIDSRNSQTFADLRLKAPDVSGFFPGAQTINLTFDVNLSELEFPLDILYEPQESVSFTPDPLDRDPPPAGTGDVDLSLDFEERFELSPAGDELTIAIDYRNAATLSTTGSGVVDIETGAALTLVFTLSEAAIYSLEGSNLLDADYDQPFSFQLSENGGDTVFGFTETDVLPSLAATGTLDPGTYIFEFAAGQDLSLSGDGSFSQTDVVNAVLSIKPVPEPTSLAVLGLGGLALIARRRVTNHA